MMQKLDAEAAEVEERRHSEHEATMECLMPEEHYQKLYAEQVGGQMEVTAPDDSRVDILTEDLFED